MCYDMSFFSNLQTIADYMQISGPLQEQFTPTWHQVAQSYTGWPVVMNEDGYRIRIFEWGLIAPYMNTPEKVKQYRSSMANARSEKILGDPQSVWHRLRRQRCLVFSTGFFEHHDAGLKKKIPFFIRSNNPSLLCFAGIYNYAPLPEPATGELPGTFAIITRPANTLLHSIHNSGTHPHRMPLMLDRERAYAWLKPNLSDPEMQDILNYAYPPEMLEAWPVNSIRTRKEDSPEVISRKTYPVDLSGMEKIS
jgi:putative SOS response-associated peptidase YedK